jgi:hypothetical protein
MARAKRHYLPGHIWHITLQTGRGPDGRGKMGDGSNCPEPFVGSIEFTTGVKTDLGVLAKGRKLQETDYGYQLREVSFPYEDQIVRKKEEIGINNTYLW